MLVPRIALARGFVFGVAPVVAHVLELEAATGTLPLSVIEEAQATRTGLGVVVREELRRQACGSGGGGRGGTALVSARAGGVRGHGVSPRGIVVEAGLDSSEHAF